MTISSYEYCTAGTEGGADEAADARLKQADYQRALGSEVHDPTYINFLTRVSRGGSDQVLRYCRTATPQAATSEVEGDHTTSATINSGSGVSGKGSSRTSRGLLLLSSDAQQLRQREAALSAHPCPHCGAPRTFECQVRERQSSTSRADVAFYSTNYYFDV